MMNAQEDHKQQLRAAIVEALHLADTQEDYCVGALLSQALEAVDRPQSTTP